MWQPPYAEKRFPFAIKPTMSSCAPDWTAHSSRFDAKEVKLNIQGETCEPCAPPSQRAVEISFPGVCLVLCGLAAPRD